MQKKIIMIIPANGYRDEELDIPRKIFEENNIKVTIASTNTDMAMGKLGGRTKPDFLVKEVNTDDYDAVVFVGGPGTDEYFHSKDAHRIANETFEKGKLLCAICIAPVILANAGLLKGVNATVFPSGAKELKDNGAVYTGKNVSVDGRIITADGPASAEAFANTIVKFLGE